MTKKRSFRSDTNYSGCPLITLKNANICNIIPIRMIRVMRGLNNHKLKIHPT